MTNLAPLRLDAMPAAPLTPAVFRTTPLQFGEAVSILGFRYAGALDSQGTPSPGHTGEGSSEAWTTTRPSSR